MAIASAASASASALVLPVGADDELAVAVPFDRRRRSAVGRALERHGIVARHRHVRRVFGDARRSHHACQKNRRKKENTQKRLIRYLSIYIFFFVIAT